MNDIVLPGTKVLVSGLVKKLNLNDKEALVLGYAHESRYDLYFPEFARFNVKVSNFTRLFPSPRSSAQEVLLETLADLSTLNLGPLASRCCSVLRERVNRTGAEKNRSPRKSSPERKCLSEGTRKVEGGDEGEEEARKERMAAAKARED